MEIRDLAWVCTKSYTYMLWLLACCFGSTPDSGNERVSNSCACFWDPFLPIGLTQPVLMLISLVSLLFSQGRKGEMDLGERGSGDN